MSKKRMGELGQPKRKMQKVEKPPDNPSPNANAGGLGEQCPKANAEEKVGGHQDCRQKTQGETVENRVQKEKRKAEKRERLELKKRARGERKAAAEKRRKETAERLKIRGQLLTRNQPKIAIWLKKGGAGLRRTSQGERTGVG